MDKVKYHVNGKTGLVAQCNASVRDCPHMSDTEGEKGMPGHYSTREAAEEVAKKMMESRFPEKKMTKTPRKVGNTPATNEKSAKGYAMMEMRNAAKNSKEEQTLALAARNGDESVLRAVAQNQYTSAELIDVALSRATNAKTRELLENHPNRRKTDSSFGNLDPANLTPENLRAEFKGRKFEATEEQIKKFGEGLNNDSAMAIVKSPYSVPRELVDEVVLTDNRNVSAATRRAALDSGMTTGKVFDSPRYPIVGMTPHMRRDEFQRYLESPTRSGAELRGFATNVIEPKQVAARKAGSFDGEADAMAVSVYKNPNSDEATRSKLASISQPVASLRRIDSIQNNNPKAFDKFYRSTSLRSSSVSAGQTFAVNPEVIKQYDLSPSDVQTYFSHTLNLGLVGVHYNPETSTVTGYRS